MCQKNSTYAKGLLWRTIQSQDKFVQQNSLNIHTSIAHSDPFNTFTNIFIFCFNNFLVQYSSEWLNACLLVVSNTCEICYTHIIHFGTEWHCYYVKIYMHNRKWKVRSYDDDINLCFVSDFGLRDISCCYVYVNIRLSSSPSQQTMAAKMQSSRDPYPFPKIQNDQDFYGASTEQVYKLLS